MLSFVSKTVSKQIVREAISCETCPCLFSLADFDSHGLQEGIFSLSRLEGKDHPLSTMRYTTNRRGWTQGRLPRVIVDDRESDCDSGY